MISRSKFFKLNLKQQIYKLAHAVRETEQNLKSERSLPPNLSEIKNYLSLLAECPIHHKREKSIQRVKTLIDDLKFTPAPRSAVGLLNFCYHDLLKLIGEPIGEKFFSVHRFDSEEISRRFPVAGILDNIRSPFNVGSMFRSADCFGIGSLALCGITLTPESLKVQRTAMGTTEHVDWTHFDQTLTAIENYRKKGYRILALETGEQAIRLDAVQNFDYTAFVFGNEEFGIPEEHLAECDQVVRIPLVGIKNSLNVANTFAIVGYQILSHFLLS